MSRKPIPRALARALLVLLSLPIAFGVLVLVEVVLVLCDVAPPRPPPPIEFGDALPTTENVVVWDRDLLYRYRPSHEFLGYYRTNSRGYRGGEFDVRKPQGVFRIVCVGDSCTFGLGVREADTWERRLEEILNRAGDGTIRFEVLSFGVVGYSTFQSRRQLELEVPRFAPDLVLYMPTVFNDATYAPEATDAERGEQHRSLIVRLRQLRLSRLLGSEPPRYSLPDRVELAATRDASHCRVPLAELPEHYRAAIDSVRRMGARLLMIGSTVDTALRAKDPGLEERMACLRNVAAEQGVPLTDAGAALRAFEPLSLFTDGVHPGPEGTRVIARAVFESLVEFDLLPESPRNDFVRWMLGLSRNGAVANPQIPEEVAASVPERFAAWLALASKEPGEANGSREPEAATDGEAEVFHRFDPLYGSEPSPYGIGRLLLRPGDDAETRARVDEIEKEVWPRDAFARFLWGESAVGAPPPMPAIESIELARAATVWERDVGLAVEPRDRRVGAAARAFARGEAESFFALTEAVLALDPGDVEARMLLARARKLQGRIDETRVELATILRIDPDYGPALAMTAILALEAKDVRAAEPLLERALAADPFALDCRYGLARLKLDRGDRSGARSELYALLLVNKTAYPDALALYRGLEEGN